MSTTVNSQITDETKDSAKKTVETDAKDDAKKVEDSAKKTVEADAKDDAKKVETKAVDAAKKEVKEEKYAAILLEAKVTQKGGKKYQNKKSVSSSSTTIDPKLAPFVSNCKTTFHTDISSAISSIDADKGNHKDKKSWREALDKCHGETRKKLDGVLDDAYKNAEKTISEMDESARDSAAIVFASSMNWVVDFHDQMVQWFKHLIGAIDSFVKGVYTAIKEVTDSIETYFKTLN